jgi:hypothetical protein
MNEAPKHTPTDFIAEAITEAFGARCPDYAEGCAVCDAWRQYDALSALRDGEATEGEPVAWRWKHRKEDESRWQYRPDEPLGFDPTVWECQPLYATPPVAPTGTVGISDALKVYQDLASPVMTALMATGGRDDLLLADKVHRAHNKARVALSAPTVEGEAL